MKNHSFSGFVNLAGEEEADLFEPLSNERIAGLVNPLPDGKMMSPERLRKATGFTMRYILAQGKTQEDLAQRVVEKFQKETDIFPELCGALALVHTDYSGEKTSALAGLVAARLQITRERIVARSLGCTGFTGILNDARSLVEDIPKGQHCVIVNIETPDRSTDARDSRATPIFAAGATATSLYDGPGHQLLFAESEDIAPEGVPAGRPIFRISHERGVRDFWGGSRDTHICRMDGDLAYEHGTKIIEQAASDSLEKALSKGLKGKHVIVVPHQPNGKMIEGFKRYTGPAMEKFFAGRVQSVRFVNGMEGMGNTISCTIPSVLARLPRLLTREELVDGALILIPAAGICVTDPEKKMSVGRGALVWSPNAFRAAS